MPVDLQTIRENPDNPRTIKDEKFKQLVRSLRDFPEMMVLRPIIIDENNVALGGNMRLKALNEIGYKTIPDEWIKLASDLTEEQKKEFIIKDNIGFGEWDWDDLANNWDETNLKTWGLDLPNWNEKETKAADEEQTLQWYLNIKCESEQQAHVMYEKFISEGLEVKIVT